MSDLGNDDTRPRHKGHNLTEYIDYSEQVPQCSALEWPLFNSFTSSPRNAQLSQLDLVSAYYLPNAFAKDFIFGERARMAAEN